MARQPTNARGTTYTVERTWTDLRTGTRHTATLGIAVGRQFTDTSLPEGATNVGYRLLAQRSGKGNGVVETRIKLAA